MTDLRISNDLAELNLDFIHGFLSNSYWAAERTKEEQKRSMANSLNFGIFLKNKQIGYARVISDNCSFAYVADVFITPEHIGNGYASKLMKSILDHKDLRSVKNWMLATKDAHTFYEKFGFKIFDDPKRMMKRKLK